MWRGLDKWWQMWRLANAVDEAVSMSHVALAHPALAATSHTLSIVSYAYASAAAQGSTLD